jgi:xylulokinase
MILIINLGLKSIRSVIFEENGKKVSMFSKNITSNLYSECVEQNANEWADSLLYVLKKTIQKAEAFSKIKYISVSCSSNCLIAVDKNNIPLMPVIMVSDKRAKNEALEISKLREYEDISSSLSSKISSYSMLARILWIKKNKGDIYEKTWKFLSPNDFLILFLTKELCITDFLNAEKCFFNTSTKRYPKELFQRMRISEEKLPDVSAIGTNIGNLSIEIKSTLNIKNNPEIILSTYDAICSIIGSGVNKKNEVCDVSGTVTSIRTFSEKPVIDHKSRVMTQNLGFKNAFVIGGSNNIGGGLIEWSKDVFYPDVKNPYDMMQKETSNNFKKSCLVFLPYLLGSRSPQWDENARGTFFGCERYHNRSDFMLAIFESTGFIVKDFLEVFNDLKLKPDVIKSTGGLTNIKIINEIKATITGIPYHVMSELESTSLGAAIITMASTKIYSNIDQTINNVVKCKEIIMPQKKHTSYYEDMYGLYKDLTSNMSTHYEKRATILKKNKTVTYNEIRNL